MNLSGFIAARQSGYKVHHTCVGRSYDFPSVRYNSVANQDMADLGKCWGHSERQIRKRLIGNLSNSPLCNLREHQRVLIRKGPVSVETSLRELEESYAISSECKVTVNLLSSFFFSSESINLRTGD